MRRRAGAGFSLIELVVSVAIVGTLALVAVPLLETTMKRQKESELRAAAQMIMQDVINDFTPHIENEIKRRLDARIERLIKRSE